jgi:hypothetical protein
MRHLSNPASVKSLADVEIAERVYRDVLGFDQCSASGRTVVAAGILRPISRHRGDHSARDLTDPGVASVRYVDVANDVHGDTRGLRKLSTCSGTVIATESLRPVSRDSGDHSARDLADSVVAGVYNVDTPPQRPQLRPADYPAEHS